MIQAHNRQTRAPFKCSKCGSAKVAAIEDKGHRSKHKHTIICTTHAPFKCPKKCGSVKVAAIEDKDHRSKYKHKIICKHMHLSSVPGSVVQRR